MRQYSPKAVYVNNYDDFDRPIAMNFLAIVKSHSDGKNWN